MACKSPQAENKASVNETYKTIKRNASAQSCKLTQQKKQLNCLAKLVANFLLHTVKVCSCKAYSELDSLSTLQRQNWRWCSNPKGLLDYIPIISSLTHFIALSLSLSLSFFITHNKGPTLQNYFCTNFCLLLANFITCK